jgi:hypothetical protein
MEAVATKEVPRIGLEAKKIFLTECCQFSDDIICVYRKLACKKEKQNA